MTVSVTRQTLQTLLQAMAKHYSYSQHQCGENLHLGAIYVNWLQIKLQKLTINYMI